MKGVTVFKIGGWVVLGLVGACVVGLLLGFVVMWLWNWLMPDLFPGVPEIDYWQAVGLFILCHLLFKSHTAHAHSEKSRDKDRKDFFKAHLHGKFGRKREDDEEASPQTAE